MIWISETDQLLPAAPTSDESAAALQKRQTGPTSGLQIRCKYSKVKGQPKGTVYKWVQATDRIECNGNESCNVGEVKQETFGIEGSVGFDLDIQKITGALTGGLTVTKQWTTGTSSECGGKDDDVVCEFARSKYVQLTLQRASPGGFSFFSLSYPSSFRDLENPEVSPLCVALPTTP